MDSKKDSHADKLHEQIDRLVEEHQKDGVTTGTAKPGADKKPSPREFIQRRMQELDQKK